MTPEIALSPAAADATLESSALVRRAAAGDGAAFDQLAARHWHDLVRLARAVAADFDAEDLAQETLTRAWSRLATLRRPESFVPWLRRMLIRDAVRAGRRRRSAAATVDERHEAPASAPVATARLEVAEALRALSPRQRAVFFLAEVDGLSTAETAAALGLAPATVRVHKLLAQRRLRELYPEVTR
ncbi:MAG: sigma-70 family RNA polymerase sigma factor [Thermoanaerobaculia bacterium]|nr:sigma-70 family RNA polymerase sigma factor [Thermoanaerobaculia bacterium]